MVANTNVNVILKLGNVIHYVSMKYILRHINKKITLAFIEIK